ncbi:MAG TPA: WxL domain-containing protein [Streptosporangiaceae bacterium]|nr:WxL domain-containing protein [Streptosporangiaceae bacterium]
MRYPARPAPTHRNRRNSAALPRRLAVTVVLAMASTTVLVTGTATPAFAGSLVSPGWAVSQTAPGTLGVDYSYTFTTASSSELDSVTMTVPAGTTGSPAVGTVRPAPLAGGGAVSRSGGTLTYSFSPAMVAAGTTVSIEITGLANTSAAGSYTSAIATVDAGTPVDSGLTPPVSLSGAALVSPRWAVSDTAPGATGVDYTYTFTTASSSELDSVTMTVPAGTSGSPAVGTVRPAPLAGGGAVSRSGGTLTYSFSPAMVAAGTTVSIEITGLANTSAAGSYTSGIATVDAGTPVDSGITPAVSFPGTLTLASPSSLAWTAQENGLNQSTVDDVPADQQLTVSDSSGTGSGWEVTVSATTFSSGSHTLPDTGRLEFNGSTSSLIGAAPSAACVGSCVLPVDATAYPVVIDTAASSPDAFTIYDASAGAGTGVVALGGPGAAHPIGWWIQVPASAYAGSYTSTLTLTLVSGP